MSHREEFVRRSYYDFRSFAITSCSYELIFSSKGTKPLLAHLPCTASCTGHGKAHCIHACTTFLTSKHAYLSVPSEYASAHAFDVLSGCFSYMEKAECAQQHPETSITINLAEERCKKQLGANDTKPNAISMNQRTWHNNPRNSRNQPDSSQSMYMSRVHTRMHPHAPGHQEPRHQVPALTHRHTPPKDANGT